MWYDFKLSRRHYSSVFAPNLVQWKVDVLAVNYAEVFLEIGQEVVLDYFWSSSSLKDHSEIKILLEISIPHNEKSEPFTVVGCMRSGTFCLAKKCFTYLCWFAVQHHSFSDFGIDFELFGKALCLKRIIEMNKE